jgi:excisionase family DNA binding protein
LPKLKHRLIVLSMAYMTTAEIAERYGVSRREIGRLRESGELPYEQKIPGRTGAYLFDADTVQQFFESRTRKTAPTPDSGDGGSPGEDSGAG